MSKEFIYDWMGGNDNLFLGINSIHGASYDEVMHTLSWLTHPERFTSFAAILATYAVVFILAKAILQRKATWSYTTIWFGVVSFFILGYFASMAIAAYLNHYFAYPRPFMVLLEAQQFEPTPEQAYKFSFPSEHVVFACLLITSLWPMLGQKLAWAGMVFVFMVGWSRVSLGMHYPADILGTLLIFVPLLLVMRGVYYTVLRKIFKLKC